MDFNRDKVLQMADTRKINYSGSTLCANYRKPLEQCLTAAQAIRLMKNCISWCLLERYPTKEEMLAFADKEVWADNGIYIDTEFNGERIDDHIYCVFIGCKGRIKTGLNLEKQIIPKLYLSEGSNLKVSVDENLMFPIDVELYYGSCVYGSCVSVKNHNSETASENINFSAEELSTDPDLTNEEL